MLYGVIFKLLFLSSSKFSKGLLNQVANGIYINCTPNLIRPLVTNVFDRSR